MKTNLFVCNTLLQVINAILIKNSYLSFDTADIVLTDNTKGMNEIAERLKRELVFDNVYYFPSKSIFKGRGKINYHWNVLKLLLNYTSEVNRNLLRFSIVLEYDNFFYYNNDLLNWFVSDILVKKSPNYKQFVFEEGVLGYNKYLFEPPINREFRRLTMIRKVFNRRYLQDRIESFFCLYPEIICNRNHFIINKIPALSKEEDKLLLSRVFGYDKDEYPIEEEVIYFTTSEDIDGSNIHEEKLVEKIAKLVGKKNILVKMHPRDTRDIYEKMGFKVYKGAQAPWEIMAIANNFTDKIFITLSSSSLITANVFKNEDVKTFYIYPLVKGYNSTFDEKVESLGIESTIELLKQHNICRKFCVINDENELEDCFS